MVEVVWYWWLKEGRRGKLVSGVGGGGGVSGGGWLPLVGRKEGGEMRWLAVVTGAGHIDR